MKLRSSKTVAINSNETKRELMNNENLTAPSTANVYPVRRSTRQRNVVNYNIEAAISSQMGFQSTAIKGGKRKLVDLNPTEKRMKINGSLPSSSVLAKTNDINSIHVLPDNVMIMIFEKLHIPDRIKIERVCRRWRILSKFSWSRTEYFGYDSINDPSNAVRQYNVGNSQIGDIIRRAGRFLKWVDLSRFRETLSHDVCRYFVNTLQLHTVDLTGIHLTNSALSKLAHYCPNLKSAIFTRCFQNTSMERGLSDFLTIANQLERLDLSENENLRGITSFSKLPFSLKHLNLENCYRLDSKAYSNIHDRCPNLEMLNLHRVYDLVSVEALNSLFKKLINLETLKFGEHFVPTVPNGADLVSLGKLRKLKNLDLHDNNLITDQALIAISRGCPNLEVMDISGCNRGISEDGLRSLGNLPSLKTLNVSCIRNFNDTCLKDICRRGTLKEFKMQRCSQVSNEGVQFTLMNCNALVKLDVSMCSSITDASVQSIYEMLEKRHGKTIPINENDENIFQLSIKNSGITTPFESKNPWLNVYQDSDRFRVPVFINLDRRGGVVRWERIMHVLIHYHNIFDL